MTETNGAPARKRSLTEEMRDAELGVAEGPDAGADRDLHTAMRANHCPRDTWCIEPAGHDGTCTVAGVREFRPAIVPDKGMARPAPARAEAPSLLPLPEIGSTWLDKTDEGRTLRVVATDATSKIERNVIGVVAWTESGAVHGGDYACGWKEFHMIWRLHAG